MKKETKRAILGAFFLAGLILLIVFSLGRYFAAVEAKRRYLEEKAEIRSREPNRYRIDLATRTSARDFLADLKPWKEALVSAEVTGKVISVAVERGDQVSEGDVLVDLDAELARIAVEAQEATHAENERLLREAETLRKRGVSAPTELDAAKARVLVSAARLREAKENLDRHTIRAPFDGVVNDRKVDAGDTVGFNEQVIQLIDISRFRVVLYASEFEIRGFKPGTRLELRIPSLAGRTYEPVVRFVTRSADPQTRLFRVEAELAADDGELRGGLQGTVTAEVARFENLPFVPIAAVRIVGDKALVEKAGPEGTGSVTEVKIGPEVDGFYPVFDGLKKGDEVLIR